MLVRTTALATASLLLLAACNGDADPAPEPAEEFEDMPGDGFEDEEEDAPETVGLNGAHDFGDGFTVQMIDTRREVVPEGPEPGEEPTYAAWTVEIANGTGDAVQTGAVTSSCFVGDPLRESEQPVLGETVNPPEVLPDGETAQWEADCWMPEEESRLHYTLEFHDEDGETLYGPVTFSGDVD